MATYDLAAWLSAIYDEEERSPTPGRRALDDLRFELKRGDAYEQHLSSRIEDGLDSQTVAWEARVLAGVAGRRGILALHAQGEETVYRACPAHSMARTFKNPDRFARMRDCPDCEKTQVAICRHCGCVHSDWPCQTVRLLAAEYAGQPGYQDEWRPA